VEETIATRRAASAMDDGSWTRCRSSFPDAADAAIYARHLPEVLALVGDHVECPLALRIGRITRETYGIGTNPVFAYVREHM
jgi:hypothetical protein